MDSHFHLHLHAFRECSPPSPQVEIFWFSEAELKFQPLWTTPSSLKKSYSSVVITELGPRTHEHIGGNIIQWVLLGPLREGEHQEVQLMNTGLMLK